MGSPLTSHAPIIVAISIPANTTTTGATIESLVKTALGGGIPRAFLQIVIDKNQPAVSTDRAAFLVASTRPGTAIAATDFTTHGRYVEAGEELNIPAEQAHLLSVRSATASAVPALATIL